MSLYVSPHEKKVLAERHVIYEKSYTPINDKFLLEEGIDVTARTEYCNGKITNRIIFQKGDQQEHVSCIHAVIGQFVFDRRGNMEHRNVSMEEKEELINSLSLDEHWFSLKSYVAGIIDFGIQNCILEMLKSRFNPLEPAQHVFNVYLQSQLLRIVKTLAPNTFNNLLLLIMERFTRNHRGLSSFLQRYWKRIWRNFNYIISEMDLSPELVEKLIKYRYFIIYPELFKKRYQAEFKKVIDKEKKEREEYEMSKKNYGKVK